MSGLRYECRCGRNHNVDIEGIKIGPGVIGSLNQSMQRFTGSKVFLIEDRNTRMAAGDRVEAILKEEFEVCKHVFDDEHFIPNECAIGRIVVEIPEDTGLIVAVGSGSINDTARFVSHKLHIPYIIVATAPSMDGYASVVSPLIVDGVKTTYSAVYPKMIIADTDVLKEAPMHMLHAGLGDILGKYTALADWRISNILNGEYFCDSVEELVLKTIEKCMGIALKIKDRNPETVESIMEALVLSGLAIGMVGASRPASGEEHHLSHCWEMVFMDRGIHTQWLHGNYVGIGAGIIIEAYRYLSSLDIKKVYEKGDYRYLDRDRWMNILSDVYGRNAKNVIRYKIGSMNFDTDVREKNMIKIMNNWDGIKYVCDDFLPDPETVRNALRESGAVYHPREVGIDRELFRKSFIAAKDIRKRYGVLQLLEDIGELEAAADEIADIYYGRL